MNKGAAKSVTSRPQQAIGGGPLRILTAVPICDGHDSAIVSINLELAHRGIELIYLGYNRSVRDIVRAAIQEDVKAVGISSYNGGHLEFFDEVIRLLRRQGASRIRVFGGGGGTISTDDARVMQKKGVDRIFFPGTPLAKIAQWVRTHYTRPNGRRRALKRVSSVGSDLELARMLSALEENRAHIRSAPLSSRTCPVIGITGPGGAGKTTLIDELVLRFFQVNPRGRIAILSHDPSLAGGGALLGDRACLVYAQDDRVFLRSLATRGQSGGLSAVTRSCLDVLRAAGFDAVLVETTGIGQEDRPFKRGLVDKQVLVLSPDYGGRLQLQKIAMLEVADVVVVNKADLPAARTATLEIEQLLGLNGHSQQIIPTVAKRHRDAGVDRLFDALLPSSLARPGEPSYDKVA